MIKVNIILAVDNGGVIGKIDENGKHILPWPNIPEDFKEFKQKTLDQIVVMGRKTWDSLPVKYRPLPGRILNVVMTRGGDTQINKSLLNAGATVCTDTESLLTICGGREVSEIWVIGGKEIYELFLHKDGVLGFEINSIHRTLVNSNYAADEAGVALPQEKMQNLVRMPTMIDPIMGYPDFGFVCNRLHSFPWGKIEFFSKPIAHDGLTMLSGNVLETV